MEVACTGKDWWTSGSQTASCSSWRWRAREKIGGPLVVRQLVAHHGDGVHGKDWWICGSQTASCSSWRRRARVKTGGPVVVRQLVAHHGGAHWQRLVDMWWSLS